MIPVDLLGLQVEATAGVPVVLLREIDEPHRVLPIFIGAPEAMSIALVIQGIVTPRPTTHDLLIDVLSATGTEIERVDLTAVHEGMFFADLIVTGPDGSHRVQSRPSDAIALAVRSGAPIFAADEVLAEAGTLVEAMTPEETSDDTVDVEAEVERFRDFLSELTAEDFVEPLDPGPDPDPERDAGTGDTTS